MAGLNQCIIVYIIVILQDWIQKLTRLVVFLVLSVRITIIVHDALL